MSDPDIDIRPLRREEVGAVMALLADDMLGRGREGIADETPYLRAYAEIEADPNNEVYVALRGDRVVGCFQLTIVPGLSLTATRRAQIEGVRIASDLRGAGLGERMIRFAIAEAESRGCGLMQLTSNNQRPDALRFYEGLGFEPTHTGFKLPLPT